MRQCFSTPFRVPRRSDDRPRSAWLIGLVVAGALIAGLAIGCGGASDEEATSAGPGTLWFAQRDGTTLAQSAGDPADQTVDRSLVGDVRARGVEGVRGLEGVQAPPPAELFATRPGAGGRQIAYDEAHERLWYSDDHAYVRSIDLRTGQAGPSLGPFSDIALWGCAVGGRARTFTIDTERNRILVSSLGGGLLGYDLDTFELDGGFGPERLGDVAFNFRRLAIDEASDTLWFTTAFGHVAAFDLDDEQIVGPLIETLEMPLGLSIDEHRGVLLVLEPADRLRIVDLETFDQVEDVAPPDTVALAWVPDRRLPDR